MEKRGSSIGGDPDDVVYIPFATAQMLYGPDRMQHLPIALAGAHARGHRPRQRTGHATSCASAIT